MKKYQILIISLSVLFLIIGVVSAEENNTVEKHPITTMIGGLSVSDQNNINVHLKTYENDSPVTSINLNGKMTSVHSNSISINVLLPTDTATISVSNGETGVNINKANGETGSSFHIDINQESKSFAVILKDKNGNALKNQQVTVTINGETITTNTDNNGEIIIGAYTNAESADISYSGTVKQNSKDSTNDDAKIIKLNSKINAASKTFKVKTKIKKYTITLKDKNNDPIKNKKVTIKIKGKTYTAITKNNGKATFKIKKLTKKGTYKSKIIFNGDKLYKPVSKKVTIKIK